MVASSSSNSISNNLLNPPPFSVGFDPNSLPHTTFVQADPSNFRAVVQRLTGASVAKPEMGLRRMSFNLHERRQTARKLEIKLGGATAGVRALSYAAVMASPVSPLECATARGNNPGTPRSPMEEEERAIAGKGFYLHPSTPRGSDPPELLPLFPLHSPRENCNSS